ncbi:MAG: ATP-binding cassette domain-containing protein [SAR324 cluster bacterium]|nr:ATP-binding cassette domain-containing protein [SAR324 cluster bacterium]
MSLLVAENLSYSYAKNVSPAISKVSVSVEPGTLTALVGPNGAGKSTLIKVISGVHAPDTGSLAYQGQPLRANSPLQARNLGIETIYQDLALADNLDVGANIFLGREPMKSFLGMAKVIDRRKMLKESREVLHSLDIEIPESSLEQPVRNLSGGQRQAIAISRAIYWNAKLLIMDEPTAALGVPEQRKVLELIDKLRTQKIGIIFISHNLNDIFAASDRILILRQGRVVGENKINETSREEVVSQMVSG